MWWEGGGGGVGGSSNTLYHIRCKSNKHDYRDFPSIAIIMSLKFKGLLGERLFTPVRLAFSVQKISCKAKVKSSAFTIFLFNKKSLSACVRSAELSKGSDFCSSFSVADEQGLPN